MMAIFLISGKNLLLKKGVLDISSKIMEELAVSSHIGMLVASAT
jgi:hypothetical protein